MDRKKFYDEWKIQKQQLQNDMDLISDENFTVFRKWYTEVAPLSYSEKSIPNYRSKIVQFLISEHIRNIELKNLTGDIVEKYLLDCFERKNSDKNNSGKKNSDNTYQTIVQYIKPILKFACPHVFDEVDWDALKLKSDEIEENNAPQTIDAKTISLCRKRYSIISEESILRKRFILEMMLQTQLSNTEIGKFNLSKVSVINESENIKYIVRYGKKEHIINKFLYEIIVMMNERDMLGFDINTYVDQMKKELKTCGIDNFKRSDLTKTIEERYQVCPQCGARFEAVSSNWCLRKYDGTDEYWIVCRENCSK